ncbi:5010_t:CDS:2 [Gigaspora margarita]|uniref:5010_t:CDS:1 n=1 Tax=Gigaspora margarita TaxID=4874 RepID=A0ABN7UG40_GIGMA|nr:5010_t:CDS:2 [Gigaspora margarita]
MSTKKFQSVNEYNILLQAAKKEYNKENYSASICSLTSIIDNFSHHNNQELAIEAKFWLAKIFEKEKDCTKIKIDQVLDWIKNNKIEHLNVAGPRERTSPGIYENTLLFMGYLLKKLEESQIN